MKTIFCDKCLEQIGASSLLITRTDIHLCMPAGTVDLCHNCATEFINWLKEKKDK